MEFPYFRNEEIREQRKVFKCSVLLGKEKASRKGTLRGGRENIT